MKYANIMPNDFSAGEGTCVSFWTQGCPHHCKGCHNPEQWSFEGGYKFTNKVINYVIDAIKANGIQRNFAILGGEPLCPENYPVTKTVVDAVRAEYPNIKIYLWTGYIYEDICERTADILSKIDVLIDGPYIEELRDITLPLRGSSNQRVIYLKENLNIND